MSARRRLHRGISLIELMIAVTILALLIVLGLPSMQVWLQNTQIRNTTESIVSGIQRARAEAVRRNQNVRFTLVSLDNPKAMDNSCAAAAAGSSWVISLDDPAGACGAAASESTVPRIVDKRAGGEGGLSSSVAAKAANGTAATSIVFNGFGRVASAGSIARVDVGSVLGGNYRTLRVELGSGGAVRTCDPAVTATSDPRRCTTS